MTINETVYYLKDNNNKFVEWSYIDDYIITTTLQKASRFEDESEAKNVAKHIKEDYEEGYLNNIDVVFPLRAVKAEISYKISELD